MKTTNKLVALLLAAVMVLGLMPSMTVHAHAHTHTPAVELNGIEEYPAITADTPATATIANGGDMAYFTFTPEKTDLYYVYSTADSDTVGYIYDADMNQINYNDDSYYGGTLGIYGPNFCMEQVMEAGTTYVIGAKFYSGSNTGDFTVTAMTGHSYTSEVTKEATCTTDGELTYTCSYCGESYTEVIPAAHSYNDETGECIHCGEAYLLIGECGDNLTWELDYFGNLTIKGTGDMYNYIVSYSENYPAPWYDYTGDITALVVEEGVTSIGNYAFYNCQAMTEVSLPETVVALGTYSFSSCYGLTEIILPSAITTIPDSCFKYCGSLADIIWPVNLTAIENNAFYSCNLSDMIVPEGVTSIGQYAFSSNGSMTKLTLPSTLTTLSDYAFASMWNTKDFVFTGDAPAFGSNVFYYANANAWYPLGNETWTEEVCQQYGGTITWSGLCSGSHTWGEVVNVPATCETGSYMTMTCTVCGYTEVSPENDDALGHDYQYEEYNGGCGDYSYTITTCSRCDYYSTDNWVWNEHNYTVTETVAPTCTSDGYDVFTCSNCGDSYQGNYTYATGHNVTEWSEPTEATCTEDGVKTGSCSVCGETATEVVTPALGHEWDEENGTANDDGSVTYPCTRCDATYTTEGTALRLGDNQFTIEANTGSTVKTYTAAQAGKLTITLNNLLYHNTYAYDNGWVTDYWQTLAIDWAFSEGFFNVYVNDVNTAYTVEGYETAASIILDEIQVAAGNVVELEIAHTSSSSYDNDPIQFNVNLALEATHTHNYTAVVTAPTCTEGGYTTYTCECGDTYTADETDALGHTEADAVRENEKAATCTEDGSYDSVVYCDRCTAELSRETVTVSATGHTVEVIPAVEATCTETGLTEGKKCTVCDEILVVQEEIPALGHDWKGTSCQRCDATRENPFTDVPEDSFYIDPVLWAVEKGITTGVTETNFNPDGNCQRAAVVTFLWRAAGEPEPTSTNNPFTDVKEGDFFYKAVLWAVEKGITIGTSASEFSPYIDCNRAQVVTFLYRAMERPAYSATESGFTDVTDTDAFYYDAVLWAVENKITNGIGGDLFGIENVCNRAAVVTFLYRTYVG